VSEILLIDSEITAKIANNRYSRFSNNRYAAEISQKRAWNPEMAIECNETQAKNASDSIQSSEMKVLWSKRSISHKVLRRLMEYQLKSTMNTTKMPMTQFDATENRIQSSG
jgi:hypothetical protein